MRTAGGRPSKVARTEALSNTSRLEDMSVPCWQNMKDDEVEVNQLVRARDVGKAAILPLAWESRDVIAYV